MSVWVVSPSLARGGFFFLVVAAFSSSDSYCLDRDESRLSFPCVVFALAFGFSLWDVVDSLSSSCFDTDESRLGVFAFPLGPTVDFSL